MKSEKLRVNLDERQKTKDIEIFGIYKVRTFEDFGTFYQKIFENFGIFLLFSFGIWNFIAIFAPNKIEKDGRKNI